MSNHRQQYKASIPVTDPGIVALVEEGSVVRKFLDKIRDTILAVESASPDLAIAMWDRFKQQLKALPEGRAEALRELGIVRAKGVRIDPADFDAIIETLEPTAEALYPLGRYRGFAALSITFEACRQLHRSPIALMRAFLKEVETLHNLLLRDLSKRIGVEMRAHYDRGGEPLPENSVTRIKAADRLGGASFIVFEN